VELPEETKRALKLWVVLAKCFNSVADLDRKSIARFGLIPSEFAVLESLYHKGPIKLSEIGKHLLLTSGSVTYVVDKLEKQGLVKRVDCPEDRRAIFAHLTDEGRERIEQIFPAHAECLRETLSGLSPEEQEIATVLLRKLGFGAKACGLPE
jgi:MarR family transcriptional regulator, 2-MHQ and catechol-resistance regulon repressor